MGFQHPDRLDSHPGTRLKASFELRALARARARNTGETRAIFSANFIPKNLELIREFSGKS
jgi:hypothetical protein